MNFGARKVDLEAESKAFPLQKIQKFFGIKINENNEVLDFSGLDFFHPSACLPCNVPGFIIKGL
jgi:hypothetical protein